MIRTETEFTGCLLPRILIISHPCCFLLSPVFVYLRFFSHSDIPLAYFPLWDAQAHQGSACLAILFAECLHSMEEIWALTRSLCCRYEIMGFEGLLQLP